jgi:hypothetical protein
LHEAWKWKAVTRCWRKEVIVAMIRKGLKRRGRIKNKKRRRRVRRR